MAKHRERSLPSQLAFPVVGIGASAGGIEALIEIFEGLPSTTGAAYVLVIHLSPDHASHLADLLQARTSMRVQQVTASMPIEANQVYVIAPNHNLTMVDGYLRVSPQERGRNRSTANIDLFFRSLAEAHHQRAVSIVLSGAGSDGSVGLTRVKELGGIAIAQEPEDAEYSSMPRAAISTGMVDFIVRASDIPQRLIDLWSAASHIRLPLAIDDAEPAANPTPHSESSERALREIMVILRSRTSHDFRHYKRATVLRRIERRLQVNGLADLQQYRDYLHLHPDETPALLQDMLISVTNFFRDKEAFDALRTQVLPQLFENRAEGEVIRAWTPGCATGEEAYSLAMLLQEASAHTPEQVSFQVFATDIDERAVAIARNGLYPEPITNDIEPARIRQFFTKDASHLRVRKELRERVLFALHNVLSDPPFSRLDLVCCRNLLIYLDRDAQADILRTFHFALRPGGYLFLGNSEAADSVSNLFSVVDKKARIYRANVAVRADAPMPLAMAGTTAARAPVSVLQPAGKRKFSFGDLHQRLIEQHAPPSVLVSRESEIVHLSDRAGRFLQYVGGEPSHNIIAVVRPELRLELRTAIYQALQTNHSVEARRVQLERDGKHFFVNMTARPVHDAEANGDFVLVLFDEVEDSMSAAPAGQPGEERDPMIAQLERELQRTKEQLQATIEQSETSTEELKASNEELQAINEELRSATEELETSKEELQSINEELTTVNAELKAKVEETGKINDDLQNLITANDIGTVFVDRSMCIKRFTPRATDVFSIIPSDIGRSLLDITHRLEYDKLADDAAEAFDSLRLIEREVRSNDGRWYLARFLPYRTTEDRIDGAVLSFIDITSRRAAEERLREGEKRMNIVAESTRDYAIITFDDQGRVNSWNTGAERIFGGSEADMLGLPAEVLYTPEDRAAGVPQEEMAQARMYGRVEEDRWHVRKDGSRFRTTGVLSRLDKGGVSGFAKIMRDLDELALTRIATRTGRPGDGASVPGYESMDGRAERLRDEFLAVVSHELKHPLNLISASAELISRSPDARGSDVIQRAAATIRRTVMSQAHIIDDLLDMSRLRTGKLSIAHAPLDWSEVVARVCSAIEEEVARKQITLERALPARPVMIDADLTRIEQIVWNLVSNAIKYTSAGGAITVSLQQAHGKGVLEVRDTGAGIDAQSLPHIFDMFRQGAAPSARKGGLGIGLSLVRELVTVQGGVVRAESEGQGKGALFTVSFPLCASVPLNDGASQTSTRPLENTTILLVDDDPGTVETFRLLLEMEGAHVKVATSAQDAMGQLETLRPDLLLSDIGMPDMDGLEFIQAIRSNPQLSKLTAFALSGYGRPDDIRRSMHAGFDAHLTKPVSLDALINAIDEQRAS
ncbi:Putative chemotaxis methyltransferase protein; contains Methylesterase domain (CheB), Methylase of chemotaxis methyl-accepting proteins domain (CheR), signal transduction histidine domain (NitrB), signal receiver (Rec) domain [Cupriavidus taiwanensis]|uniref:Protein-glutamate methylesterase n=1 Tax=Cupriavidus taiwanensis TaxID=164546 RepID=A0A975XAC9_9BURK|nr:CheR family methyltransferase [Cupriavidus taiwanensis]SOY63842.1 Putative chemotaxis methyltransferase protein; contains Methylesterase domain (CheB), Methylase of chemotaxis methyl-accepting proteins domain (CheR), signal transduction histidine domain (NitrB), signal receiver (Rec) domain [Cupriavidus taiwanensis]